MLFTKQFLREYVRPSANQARDLIKTFTQVYVLWRKALENGDEWTEVDTETKFVRPVLEILGWSFSIQVKVRDIGDVTCPDYALFRDELSRGLSSIKKDKDSQIYTGALAVAEAKHWNRTLDMRGETKRDTWKAHANPDHQMIGYLKSSRISWGVLTNGAIWRLYHQSPMSTVTEYMEINLSDIYEGVDPKISPGVDRLERFYIWWQLFQCNAFIPKGSGLSTNDALLDRFVNYVESIKERLIKRITDQAVPAITAGILSHRYRKFGTRPEARINADKLSLAAVNLIYRLLFLYAAEHKGLLPVDENGEQIIGLCTLSNSVLIKQSVRGKIYDELLSIFRTIYLGDNQLHIPSYRGDLFDPGNPDFQFLVEHHLPDAVIKKVLEVLAVDGSKAVDFECVDDDFLADISEILLEISVYFVKLPYERRELKAIVKTKEKSEFKEIDNIKLGYSPIDYLIHEVLRDILDEREKIFAAAMEEISATRKKISASAGSEERDISYSKLVEANNRVLESILNINILDPSMNTGRCLIHAIRYLTKEIICRMQVYHDLHPDIPWDWNPIYILLEQERKRSIARMSRFGLDVSANQFGDSRLLKRIITSRCIYGVEHNPTKAAFAKHNIWLTTLSVGTPFSFLDHHLRQECAAVGTLVRDDFGSVGPQVHAYLIQGVSKALKKIPDTQSQLVTGRWNANQYAVYRKAISPYHVLLDISILSAIGNTAALDLINRHNADVDALYSDPDTVNINKNLDFMHWDLEFPEIFLKEIGKNGNEEVGFDAVIGIPHKMGVEMVNDASMTFLSLHFPEIQPLYDSRWYYFAQGLRLLKHSGYIAMIIHRHEFILRPSSLGQAFHRLGVTESLPAS